MTFDPFGDFATEGYLRNFEKEKDLAIVKRAENASFTTGLDEAFASLAKPRRFPARANWHRHTSCNCTSRPTIRAAR